MSNEQKSRLENLVAQAGVKVSGAQASANDGSSAVVTQDRRPRLSDAGMSRRNDTIATLGSRLDEAEHRAREAAEQLSLASDMFYQCRRLFDHIRLGLKSHMEHGLIERDLAREAMALADLGSRERMTWEDVMAKEAEDAGAQ